MDMSRVPRESSIAVGTAARAGGAMTAAIVLGPGPTPPYYEPEPRTTGEAAVQFGVFDHLDDSGQPLGRHFENRLRLVEAYDRAGFYAYHLAEHHNTPLGLRAVT